MPLKGFCANDETPAQVNALAPDWVRIDFGAWCWDFNAAYSAMKWALDVSHCAVNVGDFTASNIALAMQHDAYDGWWLLGNEPDLEGLTPLAFANDCVAKIGFVRAVDEDAKFVLACGTHLNPAWLPNSYFDQVKEQIKAVSIPCWRALKALGAHLYNNPNFSIDAYFAELRAFANSLNPTREVWITEIGRTLDSPNAKYNPNNIHQRALDNGIERWCWYAQQPLLTAANYFCLQGTDGMLTAHGEGFKAIV